MPTSLPHELTAVINRLIIADLRMQLPGRPLDDDVSITVAELGRALGAASLLACSDAVEDRILAYQIATSAISQQRAPDPSVVKAVELILARLGNFPGRDLLVRRYRTALAQAKGGILLRLEATIRRLENTIRDAAGEPFTVTDFQHRTLEQFAGCPSISLSAPTSAGKSFVLALHIIRKLQAQPRWCIVYLVPTRALIRQVIVNLRSELRRAGLDDLPVRCIPTPIPMDQALRGIVYVLTQERLVTLLHGDRETGQVWINTLIVDEAQSIGDEGRGVVLHSVVDEVVHGFPQAEVIFACPLAKNPGYLLGLFGRLDHGLPVVERESPVSQNQLLVRFTARKKVSFELLRQKTHYLLGTRELDFDFGRLGILERRARFAALIAAKGACCLVYADGAKDAERLARLVSEISEATETEDSEIREFIDYLAEHIHPEYGLIAVLRKRVAFHYGDMPGNVRAGVEELCKAGKLRFVCCTSTLLQGINLPARDVVIENPKRGKGKAMLRADFLNLAGRAGRLTREFHGNVWCLRPEAWDRASYQGEPLQTIKSALADTVRDGGTAVQRVLADPSSASDEPSAVATISRLFTDHLLGRRTIDVAAFCPPDARAAWEKTVRDVRSMTTNLPAEVYSRNYSILPSRLEDLYQHMVRQSDPRALMLIQPYLKHTNVRLGSAMQLADQILETGQGDSFKYYYRLATQWVHERPLGSIIASAIAFHRTRQNLAGETGIIHEVIHDIEHDIRYRYAKNIRAYNDVLGTVLKHRGYADEAERLIPFHLFLESGGSHPVYMALVSLGLSRTAALLLRRRIRFAANVTPEQCLRSLRRIAPRLLNLPPFCLREVRLITGDTI